MTAPTETRSLMSRVLISILRGPTGNRDLQEIDAKTADQYRRLQELRARKSGASS